MAVNPMRQVLAGTPQGGGGYNRFSAGRKHYGTGRPMPNIGGVNNAVAVSGYNERDARREALMRRAFGK